MRNNFVAQIDAFYFKMTNDPKITAGHITTYLALANFWSMSGYTPTFNVQPEEIMAYAKLDNPQELRECLRYLEKRKYIKMYPTRIPTNGIGIKLISLYRNDKYNSQNDNRIVK
jgi:SOS-response transcriptional repressor LexA